MTEDKFKLLAQIVLANAAMLRSTIVLQMQLFEAGNPEVLAGEGGGVIIHMLEQMNAACETMDEDFDRLREYFDLPPNPSSSSQ